MQVIKTVPWVFVARVISILLTLAWSVTPVMMSSGHVTNTENMQRLHDKILIGIFFFDLIS